MSEEVRAPFTTRHEHVTFVHPLRTVARIPFGIGLIMYMLL